MVNVGKVITETLSYYTDQVVDSAEEYYSMKGESPGLYFGTLAQQLVPGQLLRNSVTTDDFRALATGNSLKTGEVLSPTFPGRKVLAFDLVFRPPKSVSLMYAIGDPYVSKLVEAAHDAAVKTALETIEVRMARTRGGKGGLIKHQGEGLAGVIFKHRTSRAMDPLLHSHCVTMNFTRRESDGAFRTLDSRRVFSWSKTAGLIYQSELRRQLHHQLGVEFTEVKNGLADVRGMPREAIDKFSKRRNAIEEELGHHKDWNSAKAHQAMTLRLRAAKRDEPEDLQEVWLREAASVGLTPESINGLCGHNIVPVAPDFAALERELLGNDGITKMKSVFDVRDVAAFVADRVDPLTPWSKIWIFSTDFTQRFGILVEPDMELEVDTSGIRRCRDTGENVYTLKSQIELELEVLDIAHDPSSPTGAWVPPEHVDAEFRFGRAAQLNAGQGEMVRTVLTTWNGVNVVVGEPGTGKTFALGALNQICANNQIDVYGAAPTHKAAGELKSGAGIDAVTVAALASRIRREGPAAVFPRPGHQVLVVDEAAMVGTRDLHTLICAAREAEAKVVLIGDAGQLNSIETGGLFAELAEELTIARLEENVRQELKGDRAIVRVFNRDPEAAFEMLTDYGRLVEYADADDAVQHLLHSWATSEHYGDSLILASRNADVDRFNFVAQNLRCESGEISEDFRTVCGTELHVGDRVIFRTNDARQRFQNFDFGTVSELDAKAQQVTVRLDRNGVEVAIHDETIGTPDGIKLGYATTVHAAQGATVDAAFVYVTPDMSKEHVKVAITRHRKDLVMKGSSADVDELIAGFGEELEANRLMRAFTNERPQRTAVSQVAEFRPWELSEDDLLLTAVEVSGWIEVGPPQFVLDQIGRVPVSERARERWQTFALRISRQRLIQRRLEGEAKMKSDRSGPSLPEDGPRAQRARDQRHEGVANPEGGGQKLRGPSGPAGPGGGIGMF